MSGGRTGNHPRAGGVLAGGSGGKSQRRENDFYPTPWEATVALLKEVKFPRRVWEPACGDGAIYRVLDAFGHAVICSDICPGMNGAHARDFLVYDEPIGNHMDAIITNPPFKLAAPFIEMAAEYGVPFAFLLKTQFWHAANRLPLFNEIPPTQVLPLTWRLDFTGGGAPTMDCAWFVWGIPGQAYKPLPKPRPEEHPIFM
jgi:hypothetical protein